MKGIPIIRVGWIIEAMRIELKHSKRSNDIFSLSPSEIKFLLFEVLALPFNDIFHWRQIEGRFTFLVHFPIFLLKMFTSGKFNHIGYTLPGVKLQSMTQNLSGKFLNYSLNNTNFSEVISKFSLLCEIFLFE